MDEQGTRAVVVVHPTLGEFVAAPGAGAYEAAPVWDGRPVRLRLRRGGSDRELFETAEALWDYHRTWDRAARALAASRVPGVLAGDLSLEEVAVSAGGRFELTFANGGRAVRLAGSLAEGLTAVDARA